MPAFDDNDFGVKPPNSPSQLNTPSFSNGNGANGSYGASPKAHGIPIPGDDGEGPIEVPATRSSTSEAQKYMHTLSMSPSQKDRRSSRNSFGMTLPIPRSK